MAEPIISDLDIASWLRKAKRQPDAVAWLDRLNDQATDAMAGGDEFVTEMTDESGSSKGERKIEARFLQQVTEVCLQRLEAESQAGGADKLPPMNSVRYLSFS